MLAVVVKVKFLVNAAGMNYKTKHQQQFEEQSKLPVYLNQSYL